MNTTTDSRKFKAGVVLTKEIQERLTAQAQKRTCSVSLLVRQACLQMLEQMEKEQAS